MVTREGRQLRASNYWIRAVERLLPVFTCGVTLWLAAGCQAFVDSNEKQCEKDDECTELQGSYCTARHVCGRDSCTQNSDCKVKLGAGSFCRSDLSCAKSYPSCTAPQTDTPASEQIVLGFMGPIAPGTSDASYGSPLLEGAELSLTEIGSALKLNDQPRKLSFIKCDDQADAAGVADYLVSQAGVPAIIGPAFSGNTIKVAQDVIKPFADRGTPVLLMTPSATRQGIADLKDSNLVWRTVPSDAIQSKALALLVADVALVWRRDSKSSRTQAPKIAMPYQKSDWGQGIKGSTLNELQSLAGDPYYLDVSSQANFRQFPYDAPTADSPTSAEWDAIATEINGFAPDIILGLGLSEFDKELIRRLENKAWPVSPPRYVLSEGARLAELLTAVQSNSGLSARILGTAPGIRSISKGGGQSAYGAFASNFETALGHPPGNLAEYAYDAAYLVAYALSNANKLHPNGADLATALTHMSCKGPPAPANITAGTDTGTDILKYFKDAQTSSCIDFIGVSGELDFNSDGEAPGDYGIWCPLGDGSDFRVFTYYDSAQEKLMLPDGTEFSPSHLIEFCSSASSR